MDKYLTQGSLDEDIYIGFWINRSFDMVQGATLTLDRGRGGLLIAFIALFVSTSGRSLWKITRCLLHFVYSSRDNPDGVQIQRQAILRNTSLPFDAALDFLGLSRAWFRRGSAVLQRTLSAATLALLLSITFIIAGIFSSRVSNGSANETLIIGRDCDTDLPGRSYTSWENEQYMTPFLNRKAAEHLAYALQCYQDQGVSQPDTCKVLTMSRLPYTLDGNASCPFQTEMCKSPSGNLLFDTGKLDSYEHMGLNKGPHVSIQIKEHCAPLTTDGFTSHHVDPIRSTINFTRYNYGGGTRQNYTFEVAKNASTGRADTAGNYEVFPVRPLYGGRPFIPQLTPSSNAKSVATLFFLVSPSTMYLNRTDDPWFSATTRVFLPNSTVEWYQPDEPATVLGCVSERIYCNPKVPASTGCVNLITATEDDFQRAWPDAQDRLALRPLSIVLQQFGALGLVPYFEAKSVPSLLSRQTLYVVNGYIDDAKGSQFTTIQTKALPSNQWQKEIEYLGQTTLAAMQHFALDYARGAWFEAGLLCEQEPCRRSCYSQKVRSSKHYSFSVLGLGLIFAIGGTFMAAALLLEPILAGLSELFPGNAKLTYAYTEWQTGSTLQLQRLAYEGLGVGTWSNKTGAVPVTAPGETLVILDMRDHEHSRLVSSAVELTKVDSRKNPIGTRPSARYAKLSSTEQV